MNVAAGPFAVAALLLVAGGAAKVFDPIDTVGALRAAGLRVAAPVVVVGALAEAIVGLYALIAGDRFGAVLVAISYVGFAAFVGWALVKHLPIASCGCFGREDTPPSVVHLVVNAGAVVAAAAVAVQPGVGLTAVIAEQPLAGVPFTLLVLVGAYAAFLALTTLPRALSHVRAR